MNAVVNINECLQSFLLAMSTAGVPYSGAIIDDGELHRFRVDTDKANTKNGWYVFYSDGIPSGGFGSWKHGVVQNWCSKKSTEMSSEEKKQHQNRINTAKRKREAALKKQHDEAAAKANEIWTYASEAKTHPYLTRKKCQAHGLGLTTKPIEFHLSTADHPQHIPSNSLIIPMYDEDREIRSLQFIYENKPDIGRDKTFLNGGQSKGTYHAIGAPKDIIYICEGYATGATIHEATGHAVAIAWYTGNLSAVGAIMRQKFPTKRIIFAADNDAWTNEPVKNPGVTYARKAASQIRAEVIIPKFDNVATKPTDFNDLLDLEGVEVVKDQLQPNRDVDRGLAESDPSSIFPNIPGLSMKSDESLYPHLQNAYAILKHDARWRNKLAFNVFSNDIDAVGDLPFFNGKPGPWTDDYDSRTAVWLSDQCGLRLNTKIVKEAVLIAAKDNPVHPVRDYLNSLEWDGEERLPYWLSEYAGADVTDDQGMKSRFVMAVSKCWMIAAVARILHPEATKVDTALILEGEQGLRKSSLLKVIGGDWFMDTPFEIGTKDGYMVIQGKWIIEMAELDSLSKTNASKAKAFFSTSEDTFRPPYASRVGTYPRQCVFAGTVNHSEYLDDETGERRYWPVKCTKIDLDGLAKVRDQLWAEAVHCYRDGQPWWITDNDVNDAAKSEQKERQRGDLWEEWIEEFIAGRSSVTMAELVQNAVGKSKDEVRRCDEIRVGKCMIKLGWIKTRPRVPGTTRRVSAFEKPWAR